MNRLTGAILVFIMSLFLCSTAYADFTYEYTLSVEGDVPTGSLPWLTVTFSDDLTNTNAVNLTISGTNLDVMPDGKEYLKAIGFNLDTSLKPRFLDFSFVSGVEALDIKHGRANNPTSGYDFGALPDTYWDVAMSFVGGAFSNYNFPDFVGNTTSYQITMANDSGDVLDLDAEDFYVMSDGVLDLYSIAQIRGINHISDDPSTLSEYEGHVAPVPVPAAAWLLGTGLLGIIGVRRKMKK
jgi:hypothetical protein